MVSRFEAEQDAAPFSTHPGPERRWRRRGGGRREEEEVKKRSRGKEVEEGEKRRPN